MKRLVAPTLALGLTIALANSAWAGGLFHRDNCCEPCKPACAPCKPACAPCRPACEPCRPACNPCDSCRPHLGQKLVGWVKGLCHRDRCCETPCSTCGGGAALPPTGAYYGPTETIEGGIMQPTPQSRLQPVPTEPMSMRSRRILGR